MQIKKGKNFVISLQFQFSYRLYVINKQDEVIDLNENEIYIQVILILKYFQGFDFYIFSSFVYIHCSNNLQYYYIIKIMPQHIYKDGNVVPIYKFTNSILFCLIY